jgi:hypothetical protein
MKVQCVVRASTLCASAERVPTLHRSCAKEFGVKDTSIVRYKYAYYALWALNSSAVHAQAGVTSISICQRWRVCFTLDAGFELTT